MLLFLSLNAPVIYVTSAIFFPHAEQGFLHGRKAVWALKSWFTFYWLDPLIMFPV